nr:methyltransferase domain-containing protein [Solirubrobacterales bacterium]
MAKSSERLRWAAETLGVEPADRLLEVGCGHGVAISLICERLGEAGRITGIDRSQKMIDAARNCNRRCVESGKAVIQTVAFEDAELTGPRFDKIFAFHVALFWRSPALALAKARDQLAGRGALY